MSGGAAIPTQPYLLPKPRLFPFLSLLDYPFGGSCEFVRTPRTVVNKQFVFFSLGKKRQDNKAVITLLRPDIFPLRFIC